MTVMGPGFSFQVSGRRTVRLEHDARRGRRARSADAAVGTCKPAGSRARRWEAARLDVTRACLDAFGQAASGGPAFPIPLDQMVHGAAVTEAVVKSATTGRIEPIT
jgi:hypothetical protein